MHETDPLTTRAALAAGMTADQLRSKRWAAPFRGVHLERSTSLDPEASLDLHTTCRALVAVASGRPVISDRTAAELYGWWLPTPEQACMHVTVRPESVLDRPGVRCHRRILTADDISEWRGIPITSPLRTLVDLAGQLCLVDLVVIADAALQLGHCTIDELRSWVERGGWRGVRMLRRSLPLVDSRSESPMETLMRLVIVLSGLPAPIPQVEILDVNGFVVARGDLKAPGVPAVFEYDGAIHNEPRNHAKDVARWRAIRAAGCEVFPYTARELFQAPHHIVTDYQRVLSLPVDATAVRGWWQEWRKSGFRRQGFRD
jgi:hypothetical protein